MTPQRGGGSISCFVQWSPSTCTSGTVTFVPGSLPSPILLLLRTMFEFWVMPNAPSSFPVFRPLLDVISWAGFGSWSVLQPQQEWGCEPGLWNSLEAPQDPQQDRAPAGAGTRPKRNHFCGVSLKQPLLCQEGTGCWHYTESSLKSQRWWSEKFPHHLIWEDTHHLNSPKPATTTREKLYSGSQNPFFGTTLLEAIFQAVPGGTVVYQQPEYLHLCGLGFGCSLWVHPQAPPHLSPSASHPAEEQGFSWDFK